MSHRETKPETPVRRFRWLRLTAEGILAAFLSIFLQWVLNTVAGVNFNWTKTLIYFLAGGLAFAYYSLIFKRKKQEVTVPPWLDLAIFLALFVCTVSLSLRMVTLYEERSEAKWEISSLKRIVQVLHNRDERELLNHKIALVLDSEEAPEPSLDSGYAYERIHVNLYQIQETGIVEWVMSGKPYLPEHIGKTPHFQFYYSVDRALGPDLKRFLGFDFLVGGEWTAVEPRRFEARMRDATAVTDILCEYLGVSDPFRYRRTICLPKSMRKKADAFILDFARYKRRPNDVTVNFVSDQRVEAILSEITIDKDDPIFANLQPVIDSPGALDLSDIEWSETGRAAGISLRTAVSWTVQLKDPPPKYVVTYYRK